MSAGLLPLLVFLPLTASAVTALLPARARAVATLLTVLATTALTIAVCAAVASSGELGLALAGWEAPLGIVLRADAASAAMLALTSVVGLAVTVYAAASEEVRGGPGFWPLLCALLAALHGVYLAGDLFNAYVTLELLTLAAVSLVGLGGRSAAAAALRYLFVAVVGSLLFLLAAALVYAEAGTLDLALAAGSLPPGPLLTTVLTLTLIGMGAKMALFPLHSWLPVAHPAAPAAVSAVLSALVIKAALFVLWRVWFGLGSEVEAAQQLALAAGIAGTVAVMWGAFMALRRHRLKQIIAYSTVAQVGYLVLILALASPSGPGADAQDAAVAGWTGGVALALAHGLAKAAMFMAAGALAFAYGSDRLQELPGAVTHMPLTVATIGIAGVSLAGLPPTFGFSAKWQLLLASLGGGQWWWVPVLLLGGLLTFGYTAMMVRATFNRPGGEEAAPPQRRAPRALTLAPFSLAVLSLLLGILPAELLGFLAGGFPGGELR